jgi:hypothetical protein
LANCRLGPDFLGVGPEKTGTSWITDQLAAHPDVWTHPAGEVRYFSEDEVFRQGRWLSRFRAAGGWRTKHHRHYAMMVAKRIVMHPARLAGRDGQLRRDLTYLFGRHDDDWYLRQFPADAAKLRGEISPQYFFLPEDKVAAMARLLPGCRIMISLRDPVSWVWSFARMVMQNGGFGRYGSLEDFTAARFAGKSFAASLTAWRTHFGAENVKVLLYDDLCDQPWAYYTGICGFLGIAPDPARQALVSQRVNAGQDRPLDPQQVEVIRRLARPDMAALAKLGVAVPDYWLA